MRFGDALTRRTRRCDERFIGYGGNKAACLFELYLSGVSFYVLPDDFLIHQSHAYAEKARKHERKYNRKLYTDFREELCFRYLNLFLDQIESPRAKVSLCSIISFFRDDLHACHCPEPRARMQEDQGFREYRSPVHCRRRRSFRFEGQGEGQANDIVDAAHSIPFDHSPPSLVAAGSSTRPQLSRPSCAPVRLLYIFRPRSTTQHPPQTLLSQLALPSSLFASRPHLHTRLPSFGTSSFPPARHASIPSFPLAPSSAGVDAQRRLPRPNSPSVLPRFSTPPLSPSSSVLLQGFLPMHPYPPAYARSQLALLCCRSRRWPRPPQLSWADLLHHPRWRAARLLTALKGSFA